MSTATSLSWVTRDYREPISRAEGLESHAHRGGRVEPIRPWLVVDTTTIIDATLKVETPRGPAWHRYQGDGYGEHADGSPFDGTGIGRAWPLLTGERAHSEVAAGHTDAAERLLQALETLAGESSLLPEQVWDTTDIPERELFCGKASGSARPLVWAHAEYLELCRSLQ